MRLSQLDVNPNALDSQDDDGKASEGDVSLNEPIWIGHGAHDHECVDAPVGQSQGAVALSCIKSSFRSLSDFRFLLV